MTRRNFPKAIKLAAYERAKGKCEECGGRLVTGKFEYDHVLADGLCGEPTLDNCMVVCANFPGSCHGIKTRKHDIPAIAKAKRMKCKHIGAKSSRPFPGGRKSKFKRKVSGEVVLREPEIDPLENYDLHHGGLSQRKEIVE